MHERAVGGSCSTACTDRAVWLGQETASAAAGEVDAELPTLGLLQWVHEHHTGHGPGAAADPRWDADPLRHVLHKHPELALRARGRWTASRTSSRQVRF
jgi:hypothetical protein